MQSLTKKTFKIYWQHSNRYRWAVAVLVVGIILTTANDLIKPFFYRTFFNVLVGADPNKAGVLIRTITYILLLGLFNIGMWRVINFVNNFYQARVMSDLLNTCYEYILNHSQGFFNNNFVGSLVTKVNRFQRSFEITADQLYWNIGRIALRAAAILAILFYRLWALGIAMLIWTALYIGFAYFFSRFKLKYDIAKAAQETKTTAYLADTITNNLNLKLFTSQAREITGYKKVTHRLFQLRKFSWDLGQFAELFQGIAMVVLEFVVIYIAIKYWQRGVLTIGDFALLQAYMGQMFENLWDLGRNIRNLYEALADANEMTAMLTEPHEVVDTLPAQNLKVAAGAIQFRHVNFHYNKETPIFTDFNLDIAAGERVALIGPSGAGKSTITNLLFGFVDIQGGEILIDGQNIARVTQNSLREHISLVPQEPILFHGRCSTISVMASRTPRLNK